MKPMRKQHRRGLAFEAHSQREGCGRCFPWYSSLGKADRIMGPQQYGPEAPKIPRPSNPKPQKQILSLRTPNKNQDDLWVPITCGLSAASLNPKLP